MLAKKYRISSDYDFKRARRIGRSYKTPLFTLVVAAASREKTLRFGFVVSNKIHKRAVHRNKIKRIFRRLVSERIKKFPPGFDVVFIARRKAVGASYEEISADFDKVLSKIHIN